jgi:hypothetical protein
MPSTIFAKYGSRSFSRSTKYVFSSSLLYENDFRGVHLQPRLDDGKYLLVRGAVGNQDAGNRVELGDHLVQLRAHVPVGLYAEVLVAGERDDLHRLVVPAQLVVEPDGVEYGVGVRVLRVRERQRCGSLDVPFPPYERPADLGLLEKVIVAVYAQHQCGSFHAKIQPGAPLAGADAVPVNIVQRRILKSLLPILPLLMLQRYF